MITWSIRRQVILLTLIPMIFTSLSLTAYFTYTQLEQISDSLDEQSRSMISQIAPSAEYALFSGNRSLLQQNLSKTLSNPHITRITIRDAGEEEFLSLIDTETVREKNDHYFYHLLFEDEEIRYAQSIVSRQLPFTDFLDESGRTENTIHLGSAEIFVTNHFSNLQKLDILGKAAAISLSILLLSTLVAVRLSKRIARPITDLTKAVTSISSGDLETRVDIDSPIELGTLGSCVNRMAEDLQTSRTEVESRIEIFTAELQQTMEELEIRNAELDIAKSNAMQASTAKSEFIANMSHEIRTPLSGVLGFTELLQKTGLDDQQREYADIISDSSRSLMMIINEILDFSKIESGKLDIVTGDCDLTDIIDNVITLLSPSAVNKNIDLVYQIDSDIPLSIRTDALRLQQILTNLVGNAVKFTDEGYVHLHVAETSDDSHISFLISDTGIGLDDEFKENLFNAFTQADTSISRQYGGTGLGLTISQKLVELLDGKIGCESTRGQGSTFWFTIPVERSTLGRRAFDDSMNHRIHCIDAREVRNRAFCSMLKNWGFDTTSNIEFDDHDRIDADLICIAADDESVIDSLDALHDREGRPNILLVCNRLTEPMLDIHKRYSVPSPLIRHSKRQQILARILDHLDVDHEDTTHRMPLTDQETSLRGSGCSVLVVDDNLTNLKLATIILDKLGTDTTAVTSGPEAIERVQQHDYDIIFMDLQMPGMDGFETSLKIREIDLEYTPKIIALTANALPQERARALESGIDEVLIKPLSIQQIEPMIAEVIDVAHDDSEPAFSTEDAIRLTAGNRKLAIELSKMMMDGLTDYRRGILSAYEREDIEDLRRQVHSLHGATRYCGTPSLRKISAQYESAIINGAETDELTTYQRRIESIIDRLLEIDIDEAFDAIE